MDEKQIKCHTSGIAAMKLSADGKFLATASNKGTLIRLFDTEDGTQVNEVRRGADQAVVSDIAIDPENKFVACASDKGTIHIFKIDDDGNKKSSLAALSGISNYFGSKWSMFQMRIGDTFSKCALFDHKVFAISNAGNYFYGELLTDGGQIKVVK